MSWEESNSKAEKATDALTGKILKISAISNDTFLIHIDKAKREILAADSLVKLKDLWNKSEAMRQLGQAAKDPELINYATEFKLRCERRLGEMLAATELDKGGRPSKTVPTHRNSFYP